MTQSRFLLVVCVALAAAISIPIVAFGQSVMGNPQLFDFVGEMEEGREKSLSIAGLRQQSIQVRVEAIDSSQAKQIEISLFDGKVFQAVQRETEGFIRQDASTFSWSGKIYSDGAWSGDVILTVHKNAMAGSIYAPSGVYSILPQANGAHVLIEIDQSLFPANGDDAQIVGALRGNPGLNDSDQQSAPQLDDGSQIDVMLVYTDDVRAFLGGTTQATAFAQQAITITNTAYQNSAMTPRVRLVHAMELNYAESNNTLTDLNFIRADAGVAAARNIYKADAVGFLVQNAPNACGQGFLMGNGNHNAAFESSAFSVSVRSCAVDNLTFPHELGHNQGAHHNPENAGPPTQTVFPYAFGHYVNGGPSPFRTILSTTTNGICSTCPRIPYFSNPSVNFNGLPTGITDQRDNARTINNTALVFSRFRNSALAVTDLRSRKMHGATAHDIDLRLGEPPGIECRTGGAGGNYQLLVTFPSAVSVGGVTVMSSDGLATGTPSVSGAVVTVDLAAVANAQTLGITLTNVTAGSDTGDVNIPMRVLLGDTNGDRFVNAGDALQTRNRSGQATDPTNFRSDVNIDGFVNSGDTTVVRSRSGTALP